MFNFLQNSLKGRTISVQIMLESRPNVIDYLIGMKRHTYAWKNGEHLFCRGERCLSGELNKEESGKPNKKPGVRKSLVGNDSNSPFQNVVVTAT